MKLIVAGATGFIGGEVLYAALQHPAVTSVVSLTRRAVVDPRIADDAKLEKIVLDDFEQYPPEVVEQLKGAVGCIWAIGGLAPKFSTYEALHKANVVYPLAAARQFIETLSPALGPERRFHFVYTSGALAERDQKKQLWAMRDSRLVKGEAENSLLDIAKSSANGSFETLITRPGFVLKKGDMKSFLLGLTGQAKTIPAEDLASVMVDMAINGADVIGGKDTADNMALVRGARKLRSKK